MLVIRFRNPRGIDMPYLLSMLGDSFMSRANTTVCPGSKMPLAMQLIFTPMILKLLERRKRAVWRGALARVITRSRPGLSNQVMLPSVDQITLAIRPELDEPMIPIYRCGVFCKGAGSPDRLRLSLDR
jgi:hypothetical protein